MYENLSTEQKRELGKHLYFEGKTEEEKKDGDIIESGNHEELLAKGGFYAELYNSQFDGASA